MTEAYRILTKVSPSDIFVFEYLIIDQAGKSAWSTAEYFGRVAAQQIRFVDEEAAEKWVEQGLTLDGDYQLVFAYDIHEAVAIAERERSIIAALVDRIQISGFSAEVDFGLYINAITMRKQVESSPRVKWVISRKHLVQAHSLVLMLQADDWMREIERAIEEQRT